jgi:tRNA (cmo5U34)-methyltransferase
MATPQAHKSTVEEFRQRFDAEVERFANLDTGQAATIDAPLVMELITQAAVAATPAITRVLDIGCGAGNNTIRLLRAYRRGSACDLCDLSLPMLERARARLAGETTGEIRIHQGDFRTIALADGAYDVVLAAAVLHHLRDDRDWEAAFAKVFRILKPGGSFWVTDLVAHENPQVQDLMWKRYGAYLESLGGPAYREEVFAYIDKEDSPRPLGYQLELLRRVGFQTVEVLHKNSCFAAFGAIKGA